MKIQLSVAHVKFGGNTGNREYFYALSEETVIVSNKNQSMEIKLSDTTDKRFTINRVLSSNPATFIDLNIIDKGRKVTFTNTNLFNQTVTVSLLVTDSKNNGKLINCDPQVLNSPDPD